MYPTEPARELSQYFVSDPELIPKIKTALRKANGGPQDPSLNPPTGKPPVWRIPTLKRRCFMLIVSPKKVVGWGGGNQNVEGNLLTFGYLMLGDSFGYLYFRLFNGHP